VAREARPYVTVSIGFGPTPQAKGFITIGAHAQVSGSRAGDRRDQVRASTQARGVCGCRTLHSPGQPACDVPDAEHDPSGRPRL
jgi:hypothetical protein